MRVIITEWINKFRNCTYLVFCLFLNVTFWLSGVLRSVAHPENPIRGGRQICNFPKPWGGGGFVSCSCHVCCMPNGCVPKHIPSSPYGGARALGTPLCMSHCLRVLKLVPGKMMMNFQHTFRRNSDGSHRAKNLWVELDSCAKKWASVASVIVIKNALTRNISWLRTLQWINRLHSCMNAWSFKFRQMIWR